MLKKLLGLIGGGGGAAPAPTPRGNPAEEALLRQIAARSKDDPLIGAKLGSKEVTQRLLAGLKTERGVHVESLLCALGSVAGYACQASVRALAVGQGLAEDGLLTRVETKDGKTFFFGDALNKPLAESHYSVWGIAAGGAQEAGCTDFPPLDEIFKYVTTTVGEGNFGVPRVPEGLSPHDTPLNYVRTLWPTLRPVIVKFSPNPEHWPILVALSIQEVILMGKEVIAPAKALKLVMECAIPMSKVDLGKA